ncbi:Dyp-type peroxidase family [Motilibacter peucedani]|uniref:Dyp-type peroxidase family n=1 Tax=Motilibacter peucedani TaxID=598650 RepID=A0A420XQ85_9ACTN|nr:peroxidase [Motilibacter peucedani]RKS75430.1 Dyp-type peroxidase family [Motilibacter peucedani]
MSGLELADIQGGVLRAYGNAYASTSYLFVVVTDPAAGRAWLRSLLPLVTTAEPWTGGKPATTLNIAVTATGLTALGVPDPVVESFSWEFTEGMRSRAAVLGDVGASSPEHWDVGLGSAHLLLLVNALTTADLESRLAMLREARPAGVEIVHEEHTQALPETREHFGFADGSAQPAIAGVNEEKVRGGGVPLADGGWRPLAAGEFILGYEDEASRDDPRRALPTAPVDPLGRNGTYLVWRKLEQDVLLFRQVLAAASAHFEGGEELLAAKVVGRWRSGAPLVTSPDGADPAFDPTAEGANDFRYAEVDPAGLRCPLGSHVRRCNPRDVPGTGPFLSFRHRMVRRGMPYGPLLPLDATEPDGVSRGLVFVCFVASISRQFEGVQVQWLDDGNIFGLGHDSDFLLGGDGKGTGKMTVQGEPPFFLAPHASFVTTRGGDYLFQPGVRALEAVAEGALGR